MITTDDKIQTYVQSRLAEAKPGMSLDQWLDDLIFVRQRSSISRFLQYKTVPRFLEL